MTKLCPAIKTATCGPACAWFREDVNACSIWIIAEGFVTLIAMVQDIIEKDNRAHEEHIQELENKEEIGLDSEEDIKKHI